MAFTEEGGKVKFLCYSEQQKTFYWSEDDKEIVSYHYESDIERKVKELDTLAYTIVEFRGETEKKVI
jgi:hypothetical protein